MLFFVNNKDFYVPRAVCRTSDLVQYLGKDN